MGLARTDVAGWYRLESIPQGRYFITAGRVDVPTFYPGTLDITKGTVVQITPGTMLTGIDFKVTEASVRSTNTVPTKQFNIPLQVTVEGGGKFVVSSPAPYLVLTRVADGRRTVISLDNSAIALPRPSSPVDYRVSVENLAGYTIKSLRFGTTDMLTNSIQLPSAAAVSSGATGTSIPIHLTLRQAPAQERR